MTRVISVTTGLALAFGVALIQSPSAQALSASSKQEFIDSVVPAAQKAQKKFGVPASVLIAQAIEASDWGTSTVAEKANNYFDTSCVAKSGKLSAAQFGSLARKQVGKPYVLGAEASASNSNPAKFDCSELVEWLYARSGNKITDLAAAQYQATKKVSGSPKVGDLVFLRNNPARFNGIGHVAILTAKKSNGDWEIVEARGRAYGVVKSTLSYWKQRSYYAGLRRQSSFSLGSGTSTSAAADYNNGCLTIGDSKYSKFSSLTNSFYGNAAAIDNDSKYASARKVMSNIPKFVDALADVVAPKDSAAYAKQLDSLIDDYSLLNYDVVPIKLVLLSDASGSKVTALQHLLNDAGYPTTVNGQYDASTVKAVKAYQKAKKLESDGEAGPYTFGSILRTVKPGETGSKVSALTALLSGLGYSVSGASYNSAVTAAVKAFQKNAGRVATGTADIGTWASLLMAEENTQPTTSGGSSFTTTPTPTITGTAKVGGTLKAATGTWKPAASKYAYQWLRDGKSIVGATKSSYVLTSADLGAAVTVKVTGSLEGYDDVSVTSSKVSVAATASAATQKTFTKTYTPVISGTAATGRTLTIARGVWQPAPVTYRYQWYNGSTKISGATAKTYQVKSADKGDAIKARVTVSKTGYQTVVKYTKAVRIK